MTKLFITGATGYIGGDFLYVVVKAHPDWEISCLVRDRSKGSKLKSAYPHVRVVYGDLLSSSIIEAESSRADIVYHFAHSDHVKSAQAIAKGLQRSTTRTGFWIHTSGAGILTHENFAHNKYGCSLPSDIKIYDDWDNISELTSLPNKAIHRHVDKIVLSASSSDPKHIKTAIVAPSCIYGEGRGTGNTSSVQVHVAAQVALSAGKALQIGDGSNIWHEIHIHDLTILHLRLGEAAAEGGGRATWNQNGYYLAENGAFTWGEITSRIAYEGWKQGFFDSAAVESIDAETARSYNRNFQYLCATTSRGISKRASMLLGWKPTQKRMSECIADIVQKEAARLKLVPKKPHRAVL